MPQNEPVFTPVNIGTLQLTNRLVRSATWEGMADKRGFVPDKYVELYRQLARGGVGLIITGFLFVTEEGKGPKGMAGISSDRHLDGLRRMTASVHAEGGKVIAQLAHCGRRVSPPRRPTLVSPAQGAGRVLSAEEIEMLVRDFIVAADRAQVAGFDGVQLHCAHGYLLSEFLSPHTNQRDDQWGGTPEKRFRMIKEIAQGIRNLAGPDFPILIKINGSDNVPGGVTPDLCTRYVQMALEAGIDAVEISGGVPESGFTTIRGSLPLVLFSGSRTDPAAINMARKKAEALKEVSAFKPHYNRAFAQKVKAAVPEMTVISVGGYRTLDGIRETISKQMADLVSMSRPLIIEPDLPHKFKSGQSQKSRCLNCNLCLPYAPVAGLRCFYGSEPKL